MNEDFVSIRNRRKIFFPESSNFDTAVGPMQPSIQLVQEALFWG